MTPKLDAVALLPEVILTAGLAIIFLVDLFLSDRRRHLLTFMSGITVAASLVATSVLIAADRQSSMVNGTYVVDDFALLSKALFLGATVLVLLLGSPREWKGEYLLLILSSLLGALMVVSSRELVTFIVAFELLAVPGYLLTGWRKRSTHGHEAALKFYLLGVVATAVMLYGASLLFGLARATDFHSIANAFGGDDSALAIVAVVFLFAGLAFKFSAVPLHFWAPDAYQGAPLSVATYLSVVSKAAALFALSNIALVALPGTANEAWAPVLAAMAIATMTIGNVIALRQTDFIRLIAYSSVAQTGYALIPLAVAGHYGGTTDLAIESLFEFLVIYSVTNIAAFAVAIAVTTSTSCSIAALDGLFYRAPYRAIALVIALLSLAGLPPLGGWFAKLVVFRAGVEADTTMAIVLVVFAAINTAIGLYYYALIVARMWRSTDKAPLAAPTLNVSVALGASTFLVVLTGVFPGLVTQLGDMLVFAS